MPFWIGFKHGLRTPREKIAFTARPKIQSQSQIIRYGGSIFCLPHRPNFSDILDLCLHWVSVVRGLKDSSLKQTKNSEVQTRHLKLGKISSSTKECQKSSAGRLCSLVLDFQFFCLSNLALRIPIYCYKYLQCWLCNELLFPLEIFR